MHGLLSQWYCPFEFGLEGSKVGYLLGMECGDFDYALYHANHFIAFALVSPVGLTEVESDVAIFCQQMQDFNMGTILTFTLPLWQFCLNLIGDGIDDPAGLSGEVMVLEEQEAILKTHHYARTLMQLYQLQLATLYDRFRLIEEILPVFVANHEVLKGHFSSFGATFTEGIAAYKLFAYTGKRKYRRYARSATKRLQGWAKQDVANCQPIASCLQGESIAAADTKKCRKSDFVCEYENAIKLAQELGVWSWEAQFQERAFQVLLHNYSDEASAIPYLRAAVLSYEKWEAFAKVESLKRLHGRFLC